MKKHKKLLPINAVYKLGKFTMNYEMLEIWFGVPTGSGEFENAPQIIFDPKFWLISTRFAGSNFWPEDLQFISDIFLCENNILT